MNNERHSVVIDIENNRIGCSDCDEWDYLILKRGDDAELFCKVWLENHLKRLDEEKTSQRMNKEFKEIVKKEENKIILKVLKDIFDKNKNIFN